MPLKRIDIPPGVDRQRSRASGDVRWYSANNMRFNDQLPESVGGWTDPESYTLKGVARKVHSWMDFDENLYTCVGTNMKFYILSGSDAFDITPVRATQTGLSNPLTTVFDSKIVTVVDVAHGASIGDFVVFTAVGASVGGFLASDFTSNTEGFQIHTVIDDDSYQIVMPTQAGSGATGGGTVDLKYKIASGSQATASGFGFGAGPYGGDDVIPTEYALAAGPFAITAGTSDISITITGSSPALTVDTGDWLYVTGLTGTLGGVDLTLFNDKWWKHSGGTSSATFTCSSTGYPSVSGGTGGGGSGVVVYHFDSSSAEVVGALRHWGEASASGSVTSSFRTVSVQNFGEDLMISNRGGPIYYYDISSKTSSSIPDPGSVAVELSTVSGSSGCPAAVDSFIVSSSHGHTIALGVNDIGLTKLNHMLIRWSDRHNPFDWTPTQSNEAGGEQLRHGSRLMGAVETRDEIVVFTNGAVYSMRYVGAPNTYGFFLMTSGVGLIARNAAVAVDNSVFFMGENQFYVYDGKVSPLSKALTAFVFEDLNPDAKERIFAASNVSFSEVMWFYPGAGSIEPNKWVSFNYSNGTWSSGSYDMTALPSSGSTTSYNRTAWEDASARDVPIAAYLKTYSPDAVPATFESSIFLHETGRNANGAAISTFIESDEIDISDGDRFVYWDRLIPDVDVFEVEATVVTPTVTIVVKKRGIPGESQSNASSMTLEYAQDGETYTPTLRESAIRGRGRLVTIRYESEAAGFGWRADSPRVSVRPDGRR